MNIIWSLLQKPGFEGLLLGQRNLSGVFKHAHAHHHHRRLNARACDVAFSIRFCLHQQRQYEYCGGKAIEKNNLGFV